MAKVLIADKLSPKAKEIFEANGVETDTKVGLSEEELMNCINDYDGVAIRSATRITKQVIENSNLKVVGRAGIGVDNIDVKAATAHGVVVMNTPHGNSITTAEHALAMMFSLSRKIPDANISTHQGKWEKSKFMGTELTGKTLGIIGCGNIGAIVADRAQGLKMKVIVHDPYLSPARAQDLAVEKVDLDDLLKRSDFITLHTPLTDGTKGIINKQTLSKMKKGARVINCARGGLIIEEDLKEAIESGHIAGAAIDVFEVEPAKENILFGTENVVCTPHLGASTTEAQEKVAVQIAEQMSAYLLTGAVSNALNVAAVTAEEAPKLKPFISLCEQLGSFAGQITETGIQSIKIEYHGPMINLNTKPLTATLLAGLFKPLLENVNMVNAPEIAKERDVNITESRTDKIDDYINLIRIIIETERGERSVAGTLFADHKPRIVEVKGVSLEAELAEYMLYISNMDKPGFIGSLGKTLGDHAINIATFHLGRDNEGGDAIALVAIDQPITNGVLEKISSLPNVVQAKPLEFVANS